MGRTAGSPTGREYDMTITLPFPRLALVIAQTPLQLNVGMSCKPQVSLRGEKAMEPCWSSSEGSAGVLGTCATRPASKLRQRAGDSKARISARLDDSDVVQTTRYGPVNRARQERQRSMERNNAIDWL
ncbi:hypothetical protein ANO11243_015020 [Dothideomycetidae sp. 11243]|nr:hypothetical protein ANO11243_015020 [fungal sp. No.11243]